MKNNVERWNDWVSSLIARVIATTPATRTQQPVETPVARRERNASSCAREFSGTIPSDPDDDECGNVFERARR